MIAHLRALSLIQLIRFAVGLGLGVFLIWRSGNIPYERTSRLEPYDQTLFLAAGSVFAALALLRGIQGFATLFVLRVRKPRLPALIISRATWASPTIALIGILSHFLLNVLQKGREAIAEFLAQWMLVLGLLAALSIASVVIAFAKRFLRGHRMILRNLGMAVAVLDLIDLTAFPVTTGCGAYGLLIYRHPDIRDFFEGVFSGRSEAPQV
jgi:hypothetical protein